jgi:hypothetical protein
VPVLSGLRESSANWKESRTVRSKLPVGDTFKFTLSEPATVALSFAAQRPGRRAHRACVTPTRRNIGKPQCTRTVPTGRLTVAGKKGPNSITFKGRPRHRRAPRTGDVRHHSHPAERQRVGRSVA